MNAPILDYIELSQGYPNDTNILHIPAQIQDGTAMKSDTKNKQPDHTQDTTNQQEAWSTKTSN